MHENETVLAETPVFWSGKKCVYYVGHSMSNTKKNLTASDLNKTWFLHRSTEIITHSEFQHSTLYYFRVRARRANDFSVNFSLPIITKSTLNEINFMIYNLRHALVAHKIFFHLI